ncbi:MAG: hypothetical protein JSS79_08535 [Bacteroidetes bacterium]|nr:hypothetical protein [Bacteroidota bacterium]
MRPVITFLLCLALCCNAAAQIGAKMQSKIYGVWQNSQQGFQMVLILNTDGKGEFDGQPIQFTVQPNVLSITSEGITTRYTYQLNGNALTLSGGDLEQKVTFAREGTTNEVHTTGANNESVKSNAPTNSSNELLGSWSGNGETITFRADGQCDYLGNVFPYQASQGYVTLSSSQGNVMFAYQVSGKQLTLSANGRQVIYTKSTGSTTVNTKGTVAMELVGQWCYMNMTTNSQSSRCITLNADGTYVYAAQSSRSVNTNEVYGGTASQDDDRGTWYVQGDRIYYNSPTKGQGSYRFEKRNHPKNVNDPMIVIEGEPYVTATARAPWR